MKKWLFFTSLIVVIIGSVFGQSNFSRGEELFMQNKPSDAQVYLENAVVDDPANVQAFLYLGITYEQLGKLNEAVSVYRQILDRAGDKTALISTNLGNAYFRLGNFSAAESSYSRALAADTGYSPAYLGRANTRIRTGALSDAVTDYQAYLSLEPGSAKRPEIERMVTYIRSEFAAEQRRKLLAEEAAREEAERKQRLLDDVASSLQSAGGDSQGLSTGADTVEGYDNDFELQ